VREDAGTVGPGTSDSGGTRDLTDLSLEDVMLGAADGLENVDRAVDRGASSWSRDGVTFATLADGAAEFRLDPLVARAALRTPDVSASPRGQEWVTFAPSELDDAAVDRAEAWFLSAARRASAGSSRKH
jgi:hypothetical protein